MRPVILRFDSLPSTNTEAARQASMGAHEGLCVVAREQTQGRGRQGRKWVSPAGAGLYFSMVLRPEGLPQQSWPLLTLMAGLAVRDALLEAFGIDADIKWPNDIIAGGLKLCGILCETAEAESGRAVILGIGVNLDDRAFPPELKGVATSIATLAGDGGAPDAEALLPALVPAISRRYEILLGEGGIEETVRAWSVHSSYAHDRPVRVQLADATFDGRTRGLEPDGALRVETNEGEIRIVRAGDVTSLRADKGKESGLRTQNSE